MDELSFIAAFSLGLLGGGHCLVMCGGISSALGGTTHHGEFRRVLLFQCGRVLSYAILGSLLGGLLSLGAGSIYSMTVLRVAAGLLLIGMGLYLSGWWHGLVVLENAGRHIWRWVQPLSAKLLGRNSTASALGVGMCWGLLPCGLIYSALTWSATAGHWLHSSALMLSFGLGTLPIMLATGTAGQQFKKLIRGPNLRRCASIILIIFGAWTSIMALQHSDPGAHHHSGTQHPTHGS